MRNLLTIAAFEFRTRLKRLSTWVYFVIFSALALIYRTKAGHRMAAMARKYAQVHDDLGRLRLQISAVQHSHLTAQREDAQSLQRRRSVQLSQVAMQHAKRCAS